MDVIIISQTDQEVGLGHFKRSLNVQNILSRDYNLKVLLTLFVDDKNKNFISGEYINLIDKNIENLFKLFKNKNIPKLVIIDLAYEKLFFKISELINFLKILNVKIIAIDGLKEFYDDLDLIFLPSFSPGIEKGLGNLKKIIYGFDCFLIDERFFIKREWNTGNNLLIMTGGSDMAKLNKSWPLLLDKMLPRDFNVHWIVGPYSQKPNLKLCKNLNFIIYKYPQDIFKIYQKVNYAITIYGVSLFELIAQGIPTVVFSIYGKKDNSEIDFINDNKLAIKSIDEVNAIEKFIELLNNKKKSQQISINSQRVLKKPGTKMLGEKVINLLKSF